MIDDELRDRERRYRESAVSHLSSAIRDLSKLPERDPALKLMLNILRELNFSLKDRA